MLVEMVGQEQLTVVDVNDVVIVIIANQDVAAFKVKHGVELLLPNQSAIVIYGKQI